MATGIIMGRFQPMTKAHYSIIKDALNEYDDVYVVVVVSKASIYGNTRRRMRAAGHNLSKEGDIESWKKKRKEGKLSKSYSYGRLGKDEQEQNPLSGPYRKHLIYKAMKGSLDQNNIISHPLADIVEITKKVSKINNDDTFYILTGSDRVRKYQPMIDAAYERGQIDKNTRVRIQEIKRDMDDVETVKATKVREAIKNGDRETFEKLTPSGIHSEFERMKKNLVTENTNRTFKKVLNEMVHIEDLDVEEFIDFVKNIYQTEASIKLDGTIALGFGFDDKGFFTGFGRDFKSIKPEKRKYSIDDWLAENHIKINSAVSAHKLLEDNKEELSDLVGDEVVLCEVLFGDKPNSIKYDFGGVNHLVILNNNAVANALKGKHSITVDNLVIEGEGNIVRKSINQTWKVGKTPTVDPSNYQIDIEAELQELQDFLNTETEGQKNFDILKMRAAGRKKELVQSARQQAKDLKINIKQKLLKDFVRNVKGGEYSPSEGYSHEGIVLKKGNKRTKIIDKSVFTQIHERDWEPINAANKIKKEMSPEEAIKEINKMIKNFDTLYPNIDEMTKRRMIESLKMTKIELRDLQ